MERFLQLLYEEWIVDPRHEKLVGSYADNVVKDGGSTAGNEKKQEEWGEGVSRGRDTRIMRGLRMTEFLAGVSGWMMVFVWRGKPG